jgi:hypothetical protein
MRVPAQAFRCIQRGHFLSQTQRQPKPRVPVTKTLGIGV